MKTIALPQFTASLRYQDAANPTEAEVAKRRRFLERYPSQEANILSYQQNPGCKCGGELQNAITGDPMTDKSALCSLIEGEPVKILTPTNMSGKLVTIDDTEEAWGTLVKRMRDEIWIFRDITVAPVADETGKRILRVFIY
jgi:hypothetical protein